MPIAVALGARAVLPAALACVMAVPPGTQPGAAASSGPAESAWRAIERGELMRHVERLADPSMRGRAFASAEEKLAAQYIVTCVAPCLEPPPGWTSAEQEFPARGGRTGRNVVFALRGSDAALRDEWIVVAAHFDHLGERGGAVYPGADDNASGTAALIETARAFSRRSRPPRRSLLFCFFTGEERGFHGSRHFIQQPPVPVSSMAAMVNADMVGRGVRPTLHVTGAETAAALRPAVEAANAPIGLELRFGEHPEWIWQSDHYVFYVQRVPIVYLGVEDHPDYHQPTDTPEKINRELLEGAARLLYRTVEALAELPQRPVWAARSPASRPRQTSRPARTGRPA